LPDLLRKIYRSTQSALASRGIYLAMARVSERNSAEPPAAEFLADKAPRLFCRVPFGSAYIIK
jgi:hypothetical protein